MATVIHPYEQTSRLIEGHIYEDWRGCYEVVVDGKLEPISAEAVTNLIENQPYSAADFLPMETFS